MTHEERERMIRLQAAAMHETTPDLYAIQISNTALGSKSLTLEGFTLVIGRYEDHWMCVWRSNNPYIKNAHDVAVCETLLQRARQIMGGGA